MNACWCMRAYAGASGCMWVCAGVGKFKSNQIKSTQPQYVLKSNQIKSSSFWESSNQIKSNHEAQNRAQIKSNQIMIWLRFQISISGVTETKSQRGQNWGCIDKSGTDRKLSASSCCRCHWFRLNRWFETKNASIMFSEIPIKSNQITGERRQIKSNHVILKRRQIKSNHVI